MVLLTHPSTAPANSDPSQERPSDHRATPATSVAVMMYADQESTRPPPRCRKVSRTFELQAAFKQDQYQGQRAEPPGYTLILRRVHQAENRPQQQACQDQHHRVGHTRPLRQPVGHEGQNQQPSKQRKEGIQAHTASTPTRGTPQHPTHRIGATPELSILGTAAAQ